MNRKMSDAQLEILREMPLRKNSISNQTLSDAATQIWLEREFAKHQEEERRFEFRKKVVIKHLHALNPELAQTLSSNWNLFPLPKE